MDTSVAARHLPGSNQGGRSAVARLLVLFGLVLALGLTAAIPAAAGPWKGKVVTEDGIPVVQNPASPMEDALTVSLEEAWRLGGETDDEDEFFGVINRIMLDDEGNVFVLDNQLNEVKIYDAEGVFLRTIGREGEGPGEFRAPVDMFFTPDGNVGVMQIAPGKIVQITPAGDPAGEYPLPTGEDGAAPFLLGGWTMGPNLALAGMENKLEEGKFTQTRFLALVDPDGNELSRLHSEARVMEFANAVIDETVWDTFDRRWHVSPHGKLLACTTHADYAVKVWGEDGSVEKVITREYERLPRTAEQIERVENIYSAFTRQVPGATIKIQDTFKDIQAIYSREDGSLWVLSSRGQEKRPDGSLGTFDVYNADGHFLRQVTLMGEGDPNEDAYFFVKDRLYVVTGFLSAALAAQGGAVGEEDEEDAVPMAVICYQIDVPNMGS